MFELLPKSWVTHPAVNSNDLLAESPSFAGIAETASTDIHIAMPTSYANQISASLIHQ